jgi:hypothetical protein
VAFRCIRRHHAASLMPPRRSVQPLTELLSPLAGVTGSDFAPPNNAEASVFNATVFPSPTLNHLMLGRRANSRPWSRRRARPVGISR